MDPDKFQQAWQSHDTESNVSVDLDLLRSEVQRNQEDFLAKIRRRDMIEIVIGLILLPFWLYMGATSSLPWTWYLTVPAILWIVGFFLIDRIRHPQRLSQPGEPLLSCVKNSLTQVEHQIWLLRNIFWWYLLPPTLSILAFFSHVAWLRSEDWLDTFNHAGNFILLFVVYYFVYWMNQRAVATDLEPRRQELLMLHGSLAGEESTSEHVAESSAQHNTSSQQLRRWTLATISCVAAVVVAALSSGIFGSGHAGNPKSSGPQGDSIAKLVSEQRKEKKLVGLATMVMVDGQVVAVAADGERKHRSGVAIELEDRWHIGGITKSVTATLIGRLVETGQMRWSDTVGTIFPEASLNPDWKPVTIRQLLTHTSGARENFSLDVRRRQPPIGPECTKARQEVVLKTITNPPKYPPGEKYAFSNVGYTIAGAMAEKVTGDSWEELVQREVFGALELTDSGFGPPVSPDPTDELPGLDQPRGHRTFFRGKVAVSDKADNTSIMGPAGTVHMSMNDLGKYATEHLRGALGEGTLMTDKTYKLLHTPDLEEYACGWMRREPSDESPFTVYWHNGSNTMWYALVVFIPEKKMVVAVASNDGDLAASDAAAWEIVNANATLDIRARGPVQVSDYPKKSPFAAVRWNESQPEVKIGDQWFKLISLDDVATDEILAFSKQAYGDLWRKRFEEDLVEVLTRMGNPPLETVKLALQSLDSDETKTLDEVPMTEANRQAICNAAAGK